MTNDACSPDLDSAPSGFFMTVWTRGKRCAAGFRQLARDPHIPFISRILLFAALLYLLCPIDVIPDFIPVLGHVDDVVIVGGLLVAAWLFIPREYRAAARLLLLGGTESSAAAGEKPVIPQ